MKRFKRLFAGLLTAALLFSVTGCSGDTTWVLKTENDTVPAGVYLSYLKDAYEQAQNQVDDTEDIWSQKIDDVPVEQWIINKATKTTKQYIAVNIMFDELGMTMGTEGDNIVKNNADTYWAQYQADYEQNGISYSSVVKLAESDYKTQKIFEYFYETDGEEPVSEDTIKEYFYDNYAKVKYVAINKYDVKTGEKKDEDALKKTVDSYVTEINKGTDIDTIIRFILITGLPIMSLIPRIPAATSPCSANSRRGSWKTLSRKPSSRRSLESLIRMIPAAAISTLAPGTTCPKTANFIRKTVLRFFMSCAGASFPKNLKTGFQQFR